jgi:hypothetical protein
MQDNKLNYMDLGTPPEPGGETFGSLLKNKLQESPSTVSRCPGKNNIGVFKNPGGV